MSGRLYAASLVALSLIIAAAISWPVFSILAALYLLVLVAWALVERAEAWAVAREAQELAEDAVAEAEAIRGIAESMADGLADAGKWQHGAEKTIARLTHENVRLSGDLLAAQLLASDAREELAAAPAPAIPLPVVREASPYDWPVADGHFPVHTEVNDDEIEALMRATEEN